MEVLLGTSISEGISIGRAVHRAENSDLLTRPLPDSAVLIAEYLSPAEIELIDLNRFNGLILERGSSTSHTAIVARTLGLPNVFGIKATSKHFQENIKVIVDGINGRIVLNPDRKSLHQYKKLQQEYQAFQQKLLERKDLPATTIDGHRFEVGANVGSIDDVKEAFNSGAEGIGVFRTELLYISKKSLPTEDEHFEVYKSTAEIAKNHSIIVRTLDIGGDKHPDYLEFPLESNPFMGLRGLRYCLAYPEVFKSQISAILRAASFGNIKLMLPMVSRVEEVIAFKELLPSVIGKLIDSGTGFQDHVQIGAMIEVPAAVEIITELSEHLEFYSIGSNDLIQY